MKTFYSEYQTDYNTYTFSYAVYCIKENNSEMPEIYSKGFLPYTGNYQIESDIFYMARSLRVNLANFEDSSENRRVDRKIAELNIKVAIVEKNKFDLQASEFQRFCTEYAEERFSGGNMASDRLDYVLSRELLTHIFVFKTENQILGYVFTALEGEMLHYWFSFYDIAYMKLSLGKWMMWKVIRWAKDNGLRYCYLGTCYKEKALYKVRDHKGTEFFDGAKWNNDNELLKRLCKSDEEKREADLFKLGVVSY
jgi:leucyl-tRNA---protein transferase